MIQMIPLTDTLPIKPPPMNLKSFESPKTGTPCVVRRAAPRAISIIAREAMKSGSPNLAIRIPVTRPSAAPRTTPASTAIIIGTFLLTRIALIIPANAATDPTDRSIPEMMITRVIPMATIPGIDACCKRFSTFPTVRKFGDNIEAITINTISSTSKLYFLSRSPIFIGSFLMIRSSP